MFSLELQHQSYKQKNSLSTVLAEDFTSLFREKLYKAQDYKIDATSKTACGVKELAVTTALPRAVLSALSA